MKKYYIHNGRMLDGPYSKEELQTISFTPFGSIWYEGPAGLTTVEDWDELQKLTGKSLLRKKDLRAIKPISCGFGDKKESISIVGSIKRMVAAFI